MIKFSFLSYLSTEFRHDFTDSRIVNSRVSHPAGHLSRAKAAKNAKIPVPMSGERQRLIYCCAQMSR